MTNNPDVSNCLFQGKPNFSWGRGGGGVQAIHIEANNTCDLPCVVCVCVCGGGGGGGGGGG